jgi:hypothetical protein
MMREFRVREWKKEAVDSFRKHCCKEVIIAWQKTKIDCCMPSLNRKKEILEPLSTDKN